MPMEGSGSDSNWKIVHGRNNTGIKKEAVSKFEVPPKSQTKNFWGAVHFQDSLFYYSKPESK